VISTATGAPNVNESPSAPMDTGTRYVSPLLSDETISWRGSNCTSVIQ